MCAVTDRLGEFVFSEEDLVSGFLASDPLWNRVAACVNACKGIRTEDLEEVIRYGKEYRDR